MKSSYHVYSDEKTKKYAKEKSDSHRHPLILPLKTADSITPPHTLNMQKLPVGTCNTTAA